VERYFQNSDWEGKIQREVVRCFTEQGSLVEPQIGRPLPLNDTPPVQFDVRLKRLERLFLETTGAGELFERPPVLPQVGNFDPAVGSR
jgi:hypothetical protein